MRRAVALVMVLVAVSTLIIPRASNGGGAVVVALEGPVDAGAEYLVSRGVSEAASRGWVLVLKIDTYGGYLLSADRIIDSIKSSGVECVAWVPPGGRAVSAGAMIAIGCGRIMMGEAAVIGAAEPRPSDEKVREYVESRITSLAEEAFDGDEALVSVVRSFVTENRVLTYDEAINMGLAEPANTLQDVLDRVGAHRYVALERGVVEDLLSVITAPAVSALMINIGLFMVIAELLQTGFQGYAVVGLVLLVLGLYGMYVIPASVAIIALLVAGAALLTAEVLTPGFGVFGVSGIALTAAAVGWALATQPPETRSGAQAALIAGLSLLGGLMVYIVYEAGKIRRLRKLSGSEALVGKKGVAKTPLSKSRAGVVHVAREDWTAYSVDEDIGAGEEVEVVRVEGLILYVRRAGRANP